MPDYEWKEHRRNYAEETENLKRPSEKVTAGHPLERAEAKKRGSLATAMASLNVADESGSPPSKPADKPQEKPKRATNSFRRSVARDLRGTRIANPLGGGAGVASPLGAAASPLGGTAATASPTASPAAAADPLSSAGASAAVDPLSSSVAGAGDEPVAPAAAETGPIDPLATFLPWQPRRAEILEKFGTSGKIEVPSFMSEEFLRKGPRQDKVKQRLEEMEEARDTVDEVVRFTQQDFVTHINELNEELTRAWENEERVKALKIVIQCSKLLQNVDVPQAYPTIFVVVTELLDNFGRLVFKRIMNKHTETGGKDLPAAQLHAGSVTDDARETCRNWFFKIASILELLPRLYVEMAIVRCYQFLHVDDYSHIFMRLASMIRGVGDPVMASYARCYLARKVREVKPSLLPCHRALVLDMLFTMREAHNESFQQLAARSYMTVAEYLNLLSPAVDWVMESLASNASQTLFRQVVEQIVAHCEHNALILDALIRAFSADHVASAAATLVALIRNSDAALRPRHTLYNSIGKALVRGHPPKKEQLAILNEVWRFVTKIEDINDFLELATTYTEYLLKFFTAREVNIMLRDIVRHVHKYKGDTEELMPKLKRIVTIIVSHTSDFSTILAMDNFMPFTDELTGDARRDVARMLLEGFAARGVVTNDLVIIHSMFDLAKSLHDSLDSLSFEDEIRQVSRAISLFLDLVSFGSDLEQHLSFLVDCRQAFINLDSVKDKLVLCVYRLANETSRITKHRHTKRTMAFVKACLAYAHITIPSIEDPLSRMRLFVLGSTLALQVGLLAQADILLKTCVQGLQEIGGVLSGIQSRVELMDAAGRVREGVCELLAALVVVPGHPEHGPFYLVRGVINVLRTIDFGEAQATKVRIYLAALRLLSTFAQRELPYRIERLESNDALYAQEETYLEELHALANAVLEQVLQEMTSLNEKAEVALELFDTIVAFGDLTPALARLAANLLQLVKKERTLSERRIENSLVRVGELSTLRGSKYLQFYQKLKSI